MSISPVFLPGTSILNNYLFGTIDFGRTSPLSGEHLPYAPCKCTDNHDSRRTNDCYSNGINSECARNVWTLANTKTALRSRFVSQLTGGAKCAECNGLRHNLLGSVNGDDRWASRINVTRLHVQGGNYRIRVWGKIPKNISDCPRHFVDRGAIVTAIKNHFNSLSLNLSWSDGLTLT